MVGKMSMGALAMVLLGGAALLTRQPAAPPSLKRISVPAAKMSEVGPPLAAATSTFATATGTIPSRLLDCTLRRITNFDKTKDQTSADFRFEGKHSFKLFLPATPVRTTAPPEATQAAEPVDPRTKILADVDGLSGNFAARFDRVVDYWPDRVEMTKSISDVAVNLIIISPIDVAHGTANMFLTKANDAVTYDENHLYAGGCKVTVGRAAETAAG